MRANDIENVASRAGEGRLAGEHDEQGQLSGVEGDVDQSQDTNNNIINLPDLSHRNSIDDDELPDFSLKESILDLDDCELHDKYIESESYECEEQKDELQTDSIDELIKNSQYSDRRTLPVGFDKLVMFYRLEGDEELPEELPHTRELGYNILYKAISSGGTGLLIQFNATQLKDGSNIRPLSLRQYWENLQLVEQRIKQVILPSFSLERCLASYVEIFKTFKVKYTPLDYRDCLRHLEVSGAYKRIYAFDGECGGSFYIKNETDGFVFYDKSSQWDRKTRSNTAKKMEDGWMRVEWRIRAKSGGIKKRLGFKHLLGLLAQYDGVAEHYSSQMRKLLPELKAGPEIILSGTEQGFRDLYGQIGGQRLLKHLAYTHLMEKGLLEKYSRASRWFESDVKRWRAEKVANVGYMKLSSNVSCADLYYELKNALQDNSDVSQEWTGN